MALFGKRNPRPSARPASPGLPDERWGWLLEQHPILSPLSAEELLRLRGLTAAFLKAFRFEGHLELTGDMKAVVAVQACLPVLELGLGAYRGLKTVVIVPGEFSQELEEVDAAGVVHEWQEELSGEAWEGGPLVLSWADVEDSGWGEGYNVVIHEAAHRLDMSDGALNGRPALHPDMSPAQWQEVFSAAYQSLNSRGRRARRRGIDPYAAESDAEFFAVASEHFFETPQVLLGQFPEVYRLLCRYYRQDPEARLRAAPPGAPGRGPSPLQ
jgi:Mlc titration factor MtfA (ptsG expression regulator)